MVKPKEIDDIRKQIDEKVTKFLEQINAKNNRGDSMGSIDYASESYSSDSADIDSPLSNSPVKEKRLLSKLVEHSAVDFEN